MTIKLLKHSVILFGTLILASTPILSSADIAEKQHVLKVCADPHYMPFSDKDKSGYENQLADLIGKELNMPVDYTWFPQRMGFIRNTLKKREYDEGPYLCDLVIGVPEHFGMASATSPYMHSTYALVTSKKGKLEALKQGNDLVNLAPEKIQDLKIGITERSPGALWLSKYSMFEQMEPYIAQSGDPQEFPGEPMFKDIESGKIDAAIVWGPTAAYFSRLDQNLRVLPLNSVPGVRFDFSISMAVRYGNDEWKEQVEKILRKKSSEIHEILVTAGIPLLAE